MVAMIIMFGTVMVVMVVMVVMLVMVVMWSWGHRSHGGHDSHIGYGACSCSWWNGERVVMVDILGKV